MKEIIDAIDPLLLKQELTPDKFIRNTNKGGNEIYSFTFQDSPHLMLEVARLRELSYRTAGGGTGAMLDIDAYDTMHIPYRQLIVWNPRENEIIGGYRYFLGYLKTIDKNGKISLATNNQFKFSERFVKKYLPYTIELGRAFVQPAYQASRSGYKSLYALDNLWDGLGALINIYPKVQYFFGKVTIYRNFNPEARNIILRFLQTYFPDFENLFEPINPLKVDLNLPELKNLFPGINYEEDFRLLIKKVRQLGENIPPLISAYMNLTPSMKVLGTTINENFGDVDETAILININDIHQDKVARHVETYSPEKLEENYATAAF
jgi:hypothetical protein